MAKSLKKKSSCSKRKQACQRRFQHLSITSHFLICLHQDSYGDIGKDSGQIYRWTLTVFAVPNFFIYNRIFITPKLPRHHWNLWGHFRRFIAIKQKNQYSNKLVECLKLRRSFVVRCVPKSHKCLSLRLIYDWRRKREDCLLP